MAGGHSPEPPSVAKRLEARLEPLFATAEVVVYALVGLVFLAGALGMLGYSILAFVATLTATPSPSFPLAIVTLINDLLLVLIIMEVLTTIVSYLRSRGITLQPFLFIAAISATRRILTIGAQMSLTGESLGSEQFRRALLDLALNVASVLIIALALFLLDRRRTHRPCAPGRGTSRR